MNISSLFTWTALLAFGIVTSCATPRIARAQDQVFVAKRVCIIHAGPESGSADLGRLETGQSAGVMTDDGTSKWIKVTDGDVEGWVYKPRGEVVDKTTFDEEPTMQFWFGNIHSHTGEDSRENDVDDSTHEDAFRYAMDDSKGNLDFLAVTPHNHLVSSHTYSNLLITARSTEFYREGEFIPIAGQEYSSIGKGNHLNVFELDAWIDPDLVANGRFDLLFHSFIPQHATDHTFAQFNHPYSRHFTAKSQREYGRDDFPDMERWIEATDKYVQAIEIVSAPSHEPWIDRPHYEVNEMRLDAWLWALSQGWHLGPTANQDNHRLNWGSASDSRTVAIASELTLESIMEALKSRRFYASEDSTMEVTFRAGDYWMGSEVPIEEFGGFYVSVRDAEEPDATYAIELFEGIVGEEALDSDSESLQSRALGDSEEAHFYINDATGGTFYFVKVTQSRTPDDHNGSEDNAWTAPIWLVGEVH